MYGHLESATSLVRSRRPVRGVSMKKTPIPGLAPTHNPKKSARFGTLEDSSGVDCYGAPTHGASEDGIWWGTANAWVVMGDEDTSGCDDQGMPNGMCDGPDRDPHRPFLFEVTGHVGYEAFHGHFIASSEPALMRHLQMFTVLQAEDTELDVIRGQRFPYKARVGQAWFVNDSDFAEFELHYQ